MAVRNMVHVDSVHGDRRMEPEQTLWIAVLSQAVRDCFTPVSRTNVTLLERDQARHFLVKDGKHFRLVCELAGRDPSYVQEKIKKHILRQNGWNVDHDMKGKMRKSYRRHSLRGFKSKYKLSPGPWQQEPDSTDKE